MHQVYRNRRIVISLFCLLSFSQQLRAENIVEEPKWGNYFKEAETVGTFVVYDLKQDQWKIFNPDRASSRFAPASTFKIPHALIALETKIIQNPRQVFPWDGIKHEIKEWNRNQTLRTAVKYSVVPVFQEFARAIGPERMKDFLVKFQYGNMDMTGQLDHFWLDDESLAISAVEEVEFLVKLYKDALPISKENQWIVKDILVNEATREYVLRAKTGMVSQIGWWVGWVETDDNAYFFACNLDLLQKRNIGDRIDIPKKILNSENILP